MVHVDPPRGSLCTGSPGAAQKAERGSGPAGEETTPSGIDACLPVRVAAHATAEEPASRCPAHEPTSLLAVVPLHVSLIPRWEAISGCLWNETGASMLHAGALGGAAPNGCSGRYAPGHDPAKLMNVR